MKHSLLLILVLALAGCGTRKSVLEKTRAVTSIQSDSLSKTHVTLNEQLYTLDLRNMIQQSEDFTHTREYNENGTLKKETTEYHKKSSSDQGKQESSKKKELDSAALTETGKRGKTVDTSKKKTADADKTVSTNIGGKWVAALVVVVLACIYIRYRIKK